VATKTYLQAISDGLRDEMRRDSRVFLIGEDIGVYGGAFKVTQGFLQEFGDDRVIDSPLSETAIVDSKPTLEIHNDDVKCNHGSTIGQLDEEAMFYLRSRGIGETEARELLIYAFASEIVDRIKVEAVREQVRRQMFRRMPERLPERRER